MIFLPSVKIYSSKVYDVAYNRKENNIEKKAMQRICWKLDYINQLDSASCLPSKYLKYRWFDRHEDLSNETNKQVHAFLRTLLFMSLLNDTL